MSTPKIFESEYRFCLVLWENEPIRAAALAALCRERLGWSRTTTYTVIRRLGDRGVLINEGGTVRSLVSRTDVQAAEIDELVGKTFGGSLPAFLAAFVGSRKLSPDEADELKKLIDTAVVPEKGENGHD